VDVEGDGGDVEGGVFFLAGPDELRVEVRIVGISFMCGSRRIGFWGDEADGRIVDASFAFVVVLLDGALGGFVVGRIFRSLLFRHEVAPRKKQIPLRHSQKTRLGSG
jgi:hypothetical protein